MSRLNSSVRRLCVHVGGAVLFVLGLAVAGGGLARAQGAAGATAPARSEAKPGGAADTKGTAKSAEKGSVTEHVKDLGRETSDPGTLQRIKAHEQDLENRIERRRERQRKDHGAARPGDAVDLAKNLDKPAGAADAPIKPEVKAGGKNKVEKTPAPTPTPPPPAATKQAPAR